MAVKGDAVTAVAPTKRRKDLDGVRGLAIALVVIFHVFVGRVSGGVDVFLMLAGYFFLGSQIRYAGRPGALANPLWPLLRTIRRLVPSLVMSMAGAALIMFLFAPEWISEEITRQVRAALTYVLNWELIAQDAAYAAATTTPSPLQHLWSMSVQGQFYLMAILVGSLCVVWPFFRTRLVGPLLIVVTIVSFAWASRGGLYGGMADYYSTWTRLWQMTFGGVLAVCGHKFQVPAKLNGVASFVGVVMMVVTGFVIRDTTAFPGPLSLLPIGGATLIVLSNGTGRTSDVLQSDFMQWLGRIAYPLYLWHWPLLILISHATGNWDVPAWLGVLVIALSLLLADATNRYIERPLQEQGPRRTRDMLAVQASDTVRKPKIAATAVIGTLVVAGLFANTAWIAHLDRIDARELDPAVYPGAMAASGKVYVPPTELYPELPEHIGTRSWRDGCLVKMDAPTDEYPDCVYGDVSAQTTVAIVGHSHADTYVEPLHLLGLQRGFRVVTMLREACPLTVRTSWLVDRDCVVWSGGAIDRLIELDPDLVVSMSTTSSRGQRDEVEQIVTGADAFWAALADHGIPFLGLRDNPRLVDEHGEPFYPNKCMRQADHWDKCAVARSLIYEPVNPADRYLSQWPTARSVDTSDWFCPFGWCSPVIGNIVVYRDRDHMTNAYARSLAPLLGEEIDAAFAQANAAGVGDKHRR
ncbi:MAG: acyltransferase family protein [Corynebacterium sp.]|uniref:acyltransferase family protein n=1 Tax=Corynebacterium sp. TaxID=1720 RepID=UPI0026DC1D82|nr:acyltransferase family protein [Corynebacterium sp.]MDO5029161.1 acyltransferase family protein [Corynebacterium sp.]